MRSWNCVLVLNPAARLSDESKCRLIDKELGINVLLSDRAVVNHSQVQMWLKSWSTLMCICLSGSNYVNTLSFIEFHVYLVVDWINRESTPANLFSEKLNLNQPKPSPPFPHNFNTPRPQSSQS